MYLLSHVKSDMKFFFLSYWLVVSPKKIIDRRLSPENGVDAGLQAVDLQPFDVIMEGIRALTSLPNYDAKRQIKAQIEGAYLQNQIPLFVISIYVYIVLRSYPDGG
jgi:hypothetical protein